MASPEDRAPDISRASGSSAARRRMQDEWRFFRASSSNPHVAIRRLRRAVSPRSAFLDVHGDYRRTMLLAGSARSGSTWLAEIAAEGLRARLIFEPLHREFVPIARRVVFDQYLDPEGADPGIETVLDRVLKGRVRSHWSDQFNQARLPRHRVVKEIRANNLLPWVTRHYPDMPIVFLLRHPLSSALSLVGLGWPTRLDEVLAQDRLLEGPLARFGAVVRDAAADDDLALRFVLRWCLENYVPVNMLGAHAAHVVFYENLAEDPRREVERLIGYLGRFGAGRWAFARSVVGAIGRPSHTNYRASKVSEVAGRLDEELRAVPANVAERSLELVKAFGLDRLYGRAVGPRVDPETVLVGSTSSSGPGH